MDGVYRGYTSGKESTSFTKGHFSNCSFGYFGECGRLGGNCPVCRKFSGLFKEIHRTKNGPPSHVTIRRVMGMISPDVLQHLYGKWQELLDRKEGELIKKIICIDGKTMRGSSQNKGKSSHIVSAWRKEDGFCLGQKAVEEKSNEITAIPELLEKLQIKGQNVTIDAMGTQKGIAEKCVPNVQTMY